MSKPTVFEEGLQTHTWFSLDWPATLDPKHVVSFLYALHGSFASKGIRFTAYASVDTGVMHSVIVPNGYVKDVLRLFATFLPDVEISQSMAFPLQCPAVFKLKMSTKNRVLNTDKPELASYVLLNALANVQQGESVLLEWMLGSAHMPVNITNPAMHFETTSNFGILLESLVKHSKQLDPKYHASMQAKHSVPSWRAVMYIGIAASERKRASALLNQIANSLRSAEGPGVRFKVKLTQSIQMEIGYKPIFWPLLINIQELAGLLAWPIGDKPMPGIQRATTKHVPLLDSTPEDKRVIAVSNVSGSNQAISLNPLDAMTHLHILGPTGVGKSTLLLNLITQDIQQGRGVTVVDPKSDLITDILKRIPANRRDDVVVINPSDIEQPVGLNPLARHGQPASLLADDILSIFRGIYGSYFGPRSEDILHAGLLTLCSTPGMSLCALPILYTNQAFRSRLTSKLNDPLGLGSFWGWYDALSESERNRVLAPLMNKLRSLIMRPTLRRVIGQGNPKFDMGEIVSGKKIVLVDLAKGVLGAESARLFGSLFFSQVWQAIQGRGLMPAEQRLPVFTYIDEFQDYLHTNIESVLTQSRSYRMGLVLAHQNLGQLPTGMRSSVLSNARSRACFQLAHEDAVVMSRTSKILEPSDFERLQRFNIYAQLAHGGHVNPWVSGFTLPLSQQISNPAVIRVLSRNRYGRNGAKVDAKLTELLSGEHQAPQTAIGRKTIEVES